MEVRTQQLCRRQVDGIQWSELGGQQRTGRVEHAVSDADKVDAHERPSTSHERHVTAGNEGPRTSVRANALEMSARRRRRCRRRASDSRSRIASFTMADESR